jgi:thiaminase/transcriptional activator TenA
MLAFVLLAGAALTDEMWTASKPIYEKTLQHAFLRGLSDGSLPRRAFEFYLVEDAKYLRAFGQALSILASKAPRDDWAITLNQHAAETTQAEIELHESLLKGVSGRDLPMAPTNRAYTNHLLVTVTRDTFSEGLAAVLPCYWIYREVGRELKRRGSKDQDYQKWIDQYSSDAYGKVVKQVLDMMNSEAQSMTPSRRRRAIELFVLGARYEYMFWDMAWRQEQWPPSSR